MSRFGWAYVSSAITGSVANGPTNSVQFNSGSGVFSGSSNFTFNPTTNVLTVVGTISASNYLGVSGSGGTTSPAGLNKYLQYNSGSVFGASSNLIFDYTTNELILTGNVKVVGQVSASTSLVTSGTISAGSNITSFGIVSFYDMFSDQHRITYNPITDRSFLQPNVLDDLSKQNLLDSIKDKMDNKFFLQLKQSVGQEHSDSERKKLSVFLKEFARRRKLKLDIFPVHFLKWLDLN